MQVSTEEALPMVLLRGGDSKSMSSERYGLEDTKHLSPSEARRGLEGTSRSSRMSVVSDARNLDESAPPLPKHVVYTSPDPGEGEPEMSEDKYRLQLLPEDIEEFNHLCLKTIGAGPTVCLRSGCRTNYQGSRSTALQRGDFVVLKTQFSAFDSFSLKSEMVSSELHV
jgi:hypothetical protein